MIPGLPQGLPPLNLTGGSSGRSTVMPSFDFAPFSIGAGSSASQTKVPTTAAATGISPGLVLGAAALAIAGLALLRK